MKSRKKISLLLTCLLLAISACDKTPKIKNISEIKPVDVKKLSSVDAENFLNKVAEDKLALGIEEARALWVYQNFITEDTASIAAKASQLMTDANVKHAIKAAEYDNIDVTAEQRRKLNIIKQSIVIPAPQNEDLSAELAKISADLNSLYSTGSYTNSTGETLRLGDMTAIMATSRNYDELLDIWQGWRTISPPMKALYQRQTELANQGANTLGYKDLGTMWRSNYDMPAEDFPKELDRLWSQVKPLYDDLHCYVKNKLTAQYGAENMPKDGTMPAHLLGNMWAQSWGNIYDLVAPENSDPGYDITEQLAKHNYSEIDMVKGAEKFFTSLGFDPLPETFWQRSLFLQPADRDVTCHASAWSLDGQDDIRIKMCIEKTGEDFSTIHHELGHNFYQRAYKNQPIYFQGSANGGFHEAIGDTISLSVTPKYLKEIGLIDEIPDESKDLGLLMKMALDKIAFIPFGLLVDQWRWKVFSGEVTPENYNQAWWDLRKKYQGITAPIERPADAFDPGAKYHIPGNTPYSRYFLAHILQFEFHKKLCEIAGNTESIHRCSIYNSIAAGEKLNNMLTMGKSQPWQVAYKTLTGHEEMNATAVLDYFAPLHEWLKEKNMGKQCTY